MCLPQGKKSGEISYGINLDIRLEYRIAAYNDVSRDRKQIVSFQMAKIPKPACSTLCASSFFYQRPWLWYSMLKLKKKKKLRGHAVLE